MKISFWGRATKILVSRKLFSIYAVFIEKFHLFICVSDGVNLPLMFAPESGNMLGGTIVNVTGPCFELTDKVSCKFDTEIVDGAVVDKNRVVCVQPRLFVEGYIYLEIAIAPSSYKWRGQYFVGKIISRPFF